MSLTIGSLFSGIGGLDLGLERAGLGPVRWQVEHNEFCTQVLARHWPAAARFRDVRHVGARELERVECIAGGFPCPDLSSAHTNGARLGLAGEQSGLWREFARVVGELHPRAVVVENVATWRDWLPVVRRDLHALGYASLPLRVPAGHVGAPHGRERVLVVAHADREGESARALHAQVARLPELAAACWRDWGQPPARALGVVDGAAPRLDAAARLRAAGNAVVPDVAHAAGLVLRAVAAEVSA